MGLNIKNSEVEALARRSAELEGTSLTEAIRLALKDRVERLENGKRTDAELYARKLREHGEAIRAMIVESGQRVPTLKEIDDDMYDEHGLPR